MLTIIAQVFGENIVLLQSPMLATNTVDTAEVAFTFDGEWDGFEKTAIFCDVGDEEYSVEVTGDRAVIPHEVITKAGQMKFCVHGSNGNKSIATVNIPYMIAEGARYRPRNH